MGILWRGLLLSLVLTACGDPVGQTGLPGLNQITGAAEARSGFFDTYWREDEGKMYLHIKSFDEPFLYISWLARGVGSNDLGLDRGQMGQTRVVRFQRVGPRVFLAQDNTGFIARSDDPDEVAAVEESFARSVIGGFDVVAEAGQGVLVDATEFFLRDSHGISARLAELEEGDYKADPKLSSIYLPRTRSFPDNTEVEAVVSFTGQPKGKHLPTVVPDPTRISVHLHHSLVRLPDEGYEPVPYEPRSGYISPWYGGYFQDYASPIDEPLLGAWLPRHRLEKSDPAAPVSEAVQPIIYYLDRGAPEPVRSALLEGALWWNQAFEAAGYKDAFQVKLLPEGADPMDVRYNIIQWVHRSTRGWSYGASVRDPRTGEIIKGHVTLGSLRVRQDRLLAEGLLAPYATADRSEAVEAMALARLRQLSAHEVGHTIGLEHNFAASVNDRASVMDYPHPYIALDANGDIDLSDAYAEGIGDWDKRTIIYGYQDFPAGVDRAAAREQILADTLDSGLHYVADQDARRVGDAHPLGSLWDNGSNAIDELLRLSEVRAVVLDNFSEAVIRRGRPLASIEEALVPMYLLHRYQLHAAGKYIGGQYFSYAMRGDGQVPATMPVAATEQLRAIDAVLATLAPEFLALDAGLVSLIPPRPPGLPASRELFARRTGTVFDPLAAAEAGSVLSVEVLLDPARAARMNRLRQTDPAQPGFSELLERLQARSWRQDKLSGRYAGLQRVVNTAVLDGLVELVGNPQASSQVRAQALDSLLELDQWLADAGVNDPDWRSHYRLARATIKQVIEKPTPEESKPVKAPPGSPIGG